MPQINSISDIVNRITGGNNGTPQVIDWFKDGRVPTGGVATTPVVGRWTSLWQYIGCPSNGIAPSGGTALIPDNTTDGSLKQISPTGGLQQWLLGIGATSLTTGTLLLYDRLLHIGNLSAVLTGSQNIGGSITRYTDGQGNQIWLEIYTQIGASGTTVSAIYTNQMGTAGNTTQSILIGNTGYREPQRVIPLCLGSGDTGVQSVTSVKLASTTGTAGNFGVNIVHPLCYVNISLVGIATLRDLITGLPAVVEIKPGACLALAWFANTVTIPQVDVQLSLINE